MAFISIFRKKGYTYCNTIIFIILFIEIDPEHGPSCAPSVLITFINMVLFKPGTAPKPCSPWMYGGQSGFQSFLVVIAVLCIPWMLLAKPIMLMKNRKKQHYQVKF